MPLISLDNNPYENDYSNPEPPRGRAANPDPYPTYTQPSGNPGAPDISFGGGFAPTPSSPAGTQTPAIAYNPPASGGGSSDPNQWILDALKSAQSTDDPNYWLNKWNSGALGSDRNYVIDRINRGDGALAVRNGTTQKYGGDYNSNSVFDDPATTAWLNLLNSRVNALNTPYQNPQLDQLNGYLQSYFQKLQGPAYTPQQMDLLQTQSLDPLSRERDAALQRERERGAARGLGRDSGIAQDRQNQIERQFEQLRTQTQAGFASKAVDLDRINAQQAAGVAQLLANIEQTAFNQNEQRANQALDIARQVPDLARQRMLDANGVLSQNSLNPTSLLGLQMNQQSADAARNQQFWLGLANLVPGLLQLFQR